MSKMRLDLFDRRFDDLIETGRARIPNLSPGWTDHNLHDPGITLMELLAWTAEAQTYALSRQRKDERIAYGAMLGIQARGRQPARGLIWPKDEAPPPAGKILGTCTEIGTGKRGTPSFWPCAVVLLAPAKLEAVRTRLANGSIIDHTSANRPDGGGFAAFGPDGNPGDVLQLELRCSDGHHLLEGSDAAVPARLALGVRIAGPRETALDSSPLSVTLVSAEGRQQLAPVDDGTAGFTHSGVLLLDVRATVPLHTCTLEITAPCGFAAAPHIQRIALNVLPVVQSIAVRHEEHEPSGLPDQIHECRKEGLQFEAGSDAIEVWSVQHDMCEHWSLQGSLDDSGPDDRHVMFDPEAARLVFGNGINGMAPAAGSSLLLSYLASEGVAGNVPRNQDWGVQGVPGHFGTNPDPMEGGTEARNLDDLRRSARNSVRMDRALVTAKDIVDAARALPGMQVARAVVPAAPRHSASTQLTAAALSLVAMRARTPDAGPAESARWLDAVRALLAPHLPLGTRLRVVAPKYLRIRIIAQLVAAPMHDPDVVAGDVAVQLAARLALIVTRPGGTAWPFGGVLSATSVAAWLIKTPGVAAVLRCELQAGDSDTLTQQARPAQLTGLPLLDLGGSDIQVRRSGSRR